MHVLHWIAIEAEDREEAFGSVQTLFEPSDEGYRMADWSDWHVVGGGRWSDSQYHDSPDMIISYATDPDKFNETIEGVRKSRINEMNNLIGKINTDKFVSDMVEYISNGGELPDDIKYDLNSYYIRNASKLLAGHYYYDSYFFDGVETSANLRYLMDRLDNPERAKVQYLVPIDFHF